MDEFNKAVETLQTFCAKRGESIRGQLDGTIPSTSEGQRSSDALVDASDISTGDMGSMNGSRNSSSNGGGFSMPGGFNMPEGFTMPEGFSMPEGMQNGGFSMPGMGGSFGGSAETTAAPETTAQIAETSSTEEAPQQPAEQSRSDRRQSPPSGMSFSGFEQTDHSSQWIQVAICAAILLAALVLISRMRAHNQ